MRIRQMIAEGYGQRGFRDLVLFTERESQTKTLGRLIVELSAILPIND